MRLIPEGTAKQNHLNTLALRLALLIAAITTSVAAIGQANEYRAYYLDVTASMEDNGIWQPVKETLKEAIKKITDETTTLEVVAWTDDNHKNGPSLKRKADENGKRELCKFIDELQTVSDCHTDVYVPFEDFYSKHAQDKGETYFFLMTDGKTFSKNREKLDKAINDWKHKTNSHTYGFYVMLTSEAAAQDIKAAVERQNTQLWTVETADVNIGHVKLEKTDYMVRERKGYCDIPVHGQFAKGEISVCLDDPFYAISRQAMTQDSHGNNALRVFFEHKTSDLPTNRVITLTAKAEKLPQYTFLITKSVEIECINKFVPAVEISFR